MRHTPPAIIALLVATLAGCTNPPSAETTSSGVTRAGTSDAHHPGVSPENVRDVMYAKLAHAHAVLEGMALEDFDQVEVNARELEALSKEAGWRVHTTVAYGVLSDEFGAIAAQLADAAKDRRMAGVTQSYMQMAESCIACHTFLRREGLYRDVPGEVSSTTPSGGDGAWVYINGQLAIDLGGVRTGVDQRVSLDRLGLADGETHTMQIFYAQRDTMSSGFRLRTTLDLLPSGRPMTISAAFD